MRSPLHVLVTSAAALGTASVALGAGGAIATRMGGLDRMIAARATSETAEAVETGGRRAEVRLPTAVTTSGTSSSTHGTGGTGNTDRDIRQWLESHPSRSGAGGSGGSRWGHHTVAEVLPLLAPPSSQPEQRQQQQQRQVQQTTPFESPQFDGGACMNIGVFQQNCNDYLLADTDKDGFISQDDYVTFLNSLTCISSSPSGTQAVQTPVERQACIQQTQSRQSQGDVTLPDFLEIPLRLQLRYIANVCRHVDDGDDDRMDCFESMYEAGMNREMFGFVIGSKAYNAEADIRLLCQESYFDFVDTGYVKDCGNAPPPQTQTTTASTPKPARPDEDRNPRPPNPDHGSGGGGSGSTVNTVMGEPKTRPPISEEVESDFEFFPMEITTPRPLPTPPVVSDDAGNDNPGGGGGVGNNGDGTTFKPTDPGMSTREEGGQGSPLNLGMIIGIIIGGTILLCGCIAFMIVGRKRRGNSDYNTSSGGSGTGSYPYDSRSIGTTEYATANQRDFNTKRRYGDDDDDDDEGPVYDNPSFADGDGYTHTTGYGDAHYGTDGDTAGDDKSQVSEMISRQTSSKKSLTDYLPSARSIASWTSRKQVEDDALEAQQRAKDAWELEMGKEDERLVLPDIERGSSGNSLETSVLMEDDHNHRASSPRGRHDDDDHDDGDYEEEPEPARPVHA